MGLLLERLYECRSALRQTIVSPEWQEWDDDSSVEATRIRKVCLRESFWTSIRSITIAVTPFYQVLCMSDSEGSTMGLLVHFFRDVVAQLQNCTSNIFEQQGKTK